MGYESKLYVVEKNTLYPTKDEKRYGQVIAMYDICKFGGFSGIFKQATNCFIYDSDGNTKITEDGCGKPLTESTIKEVVEYLEKWQAQSTYTYRRVQPLLGLLKSFNLEEWSHLVVLHYGY